MSKDRTSGRPDGFAAYRQAITRRDLLKRGMLVAGSTALAGAFTTVGAACGGESGSDAATGDSTTLNWLTWGGHEDPSIVDPFTKATGIQIKAKLYEGGDQSIVEITQNPGKYDVLTTSMEFMPQYVKAGAVQEMDPGLYPNWNDYLPEFKGDIGYDVNGKPYTMLYEFGFNGLCYRQDHLSEEDVTSFSILKDPGLKGKVGCYDWWGNTMVALSLADGNNPLNKLDPVRISDERFAHLRGYMASLRPQVAGFWPLSAVLNHLANGSIWIQPGGGDWSAQILRDQGAPVQAAIPKEGGYLTGEGISICTGTEKTDAANKFVNYMMSPEAQLAVAIKPAYSGCVPNQKAWLLMQQEEPSWATRLKMGTFDDPCAITPWREERIAVRQLPSDQTVEEWQQAWDEFKQG